MPQSLSKVFVHLVFSTKNREPSIVPAIKMNLWSYIGALCNSRKCETIRVGGCLDHVHIFCVLSRKITQADFVRDLKSNSSRWLKEKGCENFAWQSGYGIFSVSASGVPAVVKYIENQEEHHKRHSFQDEFRELLEKYGVAYDEKYVWD